MSWDASNGAVVFYIDGQQVESFTGYKTGLAVAGGGELVFGQDQDSVLGGFRTIDVFSGSLYDIRIFDDIRTAAEIESNYDQTLLPLAEPDMIANWTFSDLSATGIITESVGSNNLTEQHVVGTGFSPSAPELGLSIPENSADGTVVGNVTVIDSDIGDTFIYNLLDDAGGRFDLDPGTGVVTVVDGSLLNYEADTVHTITVEVTDSGGESYSEVMPIQVAAVNEGPVNTVPGTQVVDEETATSIAGISISDVDAGSENLTTRLVVSNGVLDVTLSGMATISAGSNSTNDLTILGTVSDINWTLASLTYTGNTDVTGVGADSLTVITNDGGNTGSGGAQQVIRLCSD